MMLRTVGLTALLLTFVAGTALAQAPPPAAALAMAAASPAVLSVPCASCHGVDGKGLANSKIPAINGRPAQELSTILKAFKADQVTVTIMNRLSKGYSDAEIDAIAGYFAAIR
jgi:cytochrome c553